MSYTAYGLQKYSVWSLLYSGATKTKYMVLKGAGFLHALLLEFVVDKHRKNLILEFIDELPKQQRAEAYRIRLEINQKARLTLKIWIHAK